MTHGLLARPAALRDELSHALPDRPFRVTFWDGDELASTTGEGPTIGRA